MFVCVCVCVRCMRDRVRERDRKSDIESTVTYHMKEIFADMSKHTREGRSENVLYRVGPAFVLLVLLQIVEILHG